MQKVIVINVFENPFCLNTKETTVLTEPFKLIDYLQKVYPKGFSRPATIHVNNIKIEIEDYDILVKEGDCVDIIIQPLVTGAIAAVAIIVGIVTYIVTKNSIPEIPSLNTPDDMSNLKKSGGNAYNLREPRNLVRMDEPIPSQYGRFRWFPDLVMPSFIEFKDNKQVINYFVSLGKGYHFIEDLFIKSFSILTSPSTEYHLSGPGGFLTGSDVKNVYNNVITEDFDQTALVSATRYMRTGFFPDASYSRAQGRIRLTTGQGLDNTFSEGDEIRVYTQHKTLGEYDIDNVYTVTAVSDRDIYMDGSDWLLNSQVTTLGIIAAERAIPNPYFEYMEDPHVIRGGKYFVDGAYSGIISLTDDVFDACIYTMDFAMVNGIIAYDATVAPPGRKTPYPEIGVIRAHVDSLGNVVDHYVITSSVTMPSQFSPGVFRYRTPIINVKWVNPELDGVYFNFTFKEQLKDPQLYFEDITGVIPEEDIVSIDYFTGVVIFTTDRGPFVSARNGVVRRSYVEPPYLFSLSSDLEASKGTFRETVDLRVHTATPEIDDDIFSAEIINAPRYSKLIVYATKSIEGKYLEYLMLDSGAIKRLKKHRYNIRYLKDVDVLQVRYTVEDSEELPEIRGEKLSVLSTRKLMFYDTREGETRWFADALTFPLQCQSRSIAWAIAEVWRSSFGAGRPYILLDLVKLQELDELWESRGDTFDGVFDSTVTPWEAMTKIARVGRARPIFDGAFLTFVRDEEKTTYTAMYNAENIIPGSFNIEYSFSDEQTPSGFEVRYLDEDNDFTKASVLSEGADSNTQTIEFFGCVNYAQAWREAQYLQAQSLSQRMSISFSTEMAGHIPFYGDLISVQHDLPSWGYGGKVIAYSGLSVTTDQKLEWGGTPPFLMSFMHPEGYLVGPFTVTQGSGDFNAILDTPLGFTPIVDRTNQNLTQYQFGPSDNWNKECIVTEIKPTASNSKVAIKCVPYAQSIHDADKGTPSTKPDISTTSLVPIPAKCSGLTLQNSTGSGIVVITWNPLDSVFFQQDKSFSRVQVEKSTDNINWSIVTVVNQRYPTATISATGLIYIRIALVRREELEVVDVLGPYLTRSIVAT